MKARHAGAVARVLAEVDRPGPPSTHHGTCWAVHAPCLAHRLRRLYAEPTPERAEQAAADMVHELRAGRGPR